ncbi:MAG: acetyl-CoA carboxylase biotin carboxyl carrier protein subunit, partial [Muribaculaceae bacterium]|nr:acetyl-CoA carboxylase biotin carboxyl carrier protein subunit [Muribaculaceae bacterium]
LSVKVKPGQTIVPGDVVIVYEAMKMENDLASEIGGVVKRVLVSDGDVMATDQPLIEFEGNSGAAPAPAAPVVHGEIMVAPMGGTVIAFKVKPGDAVKAGDTLLVYEAMKMENNFMADRDGVVKEFLVKEGDVIATDQPIVEFAAAGEEKAAPKPVAPKPVQAHQVAKVPNVKVDPVAGIDENKALHPLEGGTGDAPTALHNYTGEGAIHVAPGMDVDIKMAPDGSITIHISKK